MKNLVKMGVSNRYFIFLFIFFTATKSIYSQKKINFFLLEKNNKDYVFKVEDFEDKKIVVLIPKQTKLNFSILSFIVKKSLFNPCKEIKYKNFKWIIDNERYKYKIGKENIIELNNFKKLIFILKTKNGFFAYKVENRIIKEY